VSVDINGMILERSVAICAPGFRSSSTEFSAVYEWRPSKRRRVRVEVHRPGSELHVASKATPSMCVVLLFMNERLICANEAP
jgi:hypothetical protein